MKNIIVALIVVFSAQYAFADTAVWYKNGTVDVWTNFHQKGVQYCGEKRFGEVCDDQSTIKKIETVPDGTEALELGIGYTGGLQAQSDNLLAAQEEKEMAAKKQRDAVYDQERAKQHRADVRKYGKDRADRLDNTIEGRSSTSAKSFGLGRTYRTYTNK